MAGLRESSAQTTVEYQTEPATVAQVCQEVLEQIGKVTDISRETGTIAGKIPLSALTLAVKIFLRIAKRGNITELSIQTNSVEGLITLNRAQKALTMFTKAMGADKRLAGKSTAGW